jgi:hypothetical protein
MLGRRRIQPEAKRVSREHVRTKELTGLGIKCSRLRRVREAGHTVGSEK